MSVISGFLFIIFSGHAFAESSNDAKWKKVSSKKQAVVWARDVEGTAIKEVKLEAVIHAPVEQVWKTIKEVQYYTQFLPYVEDIQIIKRTDANSVYVYHRIDPPFVSHRDYTLLITDEVDVANGQYHRFWTQKNAVGPDVIAGVVRLEICDGSWTLTSTENGETRVVYWVYTDPGGRIPKWLANKVNKTALYDVLFAIEKRAQDLSWQ
ncbi:MAG: cyclase [Pseudomonadales bacterium]|nr:cyclase [Pseudomonadales bacterium]